jgi:hypothetical protein
MRKFYILFAMVVCMVFTAGLFAQSNFNVEAYQQFLQSNQNLEAGELLVRHAPTNTYYADLKLAASPNAYAYFDSIQIKYKLTDAEMALLERNQFVVSERLSFGQLGNAFHDIYIKDLPVMVTTDAILFALHASYDKILIALEADILESNLKKFLNGLSESFPELVRLNATPGLETALADVDVYVTIANSLLLERQQKPQLANPAQIDALWQAIQAEKLMAIPLFSERDRKIDFSQFTVRGHYNSPIWTESGERVLAAYFKTMMWLGRMEFYLTPPPPNPWELPWSREEIRRMNLGALLLNELIDLAQVRPLLEENDGMLQFLVGESDNLTSAELSQILTEQGIQSANQLFDESVYDAFQSALLQSQNAGQKILSNFLLMDPSSTEPDTLPVSYRVMGQRFIIDSYIFYNVVFPQIFYQNNKVWRPLPDPLDAMFVLGNDNALPLLEKELEQYQYASQAAALRYLVNSYDDEFWNSSLYNVWLQSIRRLNPPQTAEPLPLFMHTTAWQAQKLNTQLASWAQLRHDNLLYAKQSYTGSTGCSYPHAFVEPFPEFYESIGNFAAIAGAYFNELPYSGFSINSIKKYFPKLEKVMRQLAEISRKEIARQPLIPAEIRFLKDMLWVGGMSGEPPYSGWFGDLFIDPWSSVFDDFVIADVHTQPTELDGTEIGRVLHVAVGNFNLGVFLAEAPGNAFEPTAFVGPVMSYYELKTINFDRLTDQRWAELVQQNTVPARPDWVNIYLADAKGNSLQPGRELSGAHYTHIDLSGQTAPTTFYLAQNYPNPFNPVTAISYVLPQASQVRITIFDVAGRLVEVLKNEMQPAGHHQIRWEAPQLASGVYFCHFQAGSWRQTIKMILMR